MVPNPGVVPEQVAQARVGLEPYGNMAHKDAVREVEAICPGRPPDYEIHGAEPWTSPYKQPHTYIAWGLNLFLFLALVFLALFASFLSRALRRPAIHPFPKIFLPVILPRARDEYQE